VWSEAGASAWGSSTKSTVGYDFLRRVQESGRDVGRGPGAPFNT
jgi:hypothetical protein